MLDQIRGATRLIRAGNAVADAVIIATLTSMLEVIWPIS
jgi:hypothetical protein